MVRRYIFIIMTLLFVSMSAASQYYKPSVKNGDDAMNVRNYRSALKWYEMARKCMDAPKDKKEIDRKIEKAKAKLSGPKCDLSLGAERVSLLSDGGSRQVAIKTGNVKGWVLVSKPDWITVKNTSGREIDIQFEKNASISARSGVIVIEPKGCGSKSRKSIHVAQGGERVYLSLSGSGTTLGGKGGSGSFSVKTNDYGFHTSTQAPWIRLSGKSDSVVYVCEKNTQKTSRAGEITVTTTSGVTQVFMVTQNKRIWILRFIDSLLSRP